MNEQFVKYPIAKSLRDINFDEDCIAGYSIDESHKLDFLFRTSQVPIRKNSQMLYLMVPTYQQVTDWFREKHNIRIYEVMTVMGNGFCFKTNQRDHPTSNGTTILIDTYVKTSFADTYYDCYEKAIIEGIKLVSIAEISKGGTLKKEN